MTFDVYTDSGKWSIEPTLEAALVEQSCVERSGGSLAWVLRSDDVPITSLEEGAVRCELRIL